MCLCMYVGIERKGNAWHAVHGWYDLYAIFGPSPIHRLPFQNWSPHIGTCVSICMYVCMQRKERKFRDFCARITMNYMQFSNLDLSIDSHFKTQLDQLGHVCLHTCMHKKERKCMECWAWIFRIYMRFLNVILSIDSHFKTEIHKSVRVCVYMYVCIRKKGKERKCKDCCAYPIYMRFLDLDLSINSHFKTQLHQFVHVCLYVCMQKKKRKENAWNVVHAWSRFTWDFWT